MLGSSKYGTILVINRLIEECVEICVFFAEVLV